MINANSHKEGLLLLTEDLKETVLFSGYAKLPVGITASEVYKIIGLIVVVDIKTGVIIDADCTLATRAAREYLTKLMMGYDLDYGPEGMQAILEKQYQSSAKKAISTAFRIIHDKYRSYLFELQQEQNNN
ncbi:MAG TPA: DUF3870 domain-containing protein [Candidatus Avacidaminococcus intestinavium]|uniref:DUF3870 domain-containing protein n=1 Tax=Candidatus Avacidaminococcus intestinavium TaxID=2840684 RepID=A0A9D1SLD1_9FIRM|nr:DUF3870 domain-containing protein [Candidatus Avacidaminococcus intestinavium]